MKKNILLLLITFSSIISFGQINPNTLLPNVMPSNPQAFQFMKYGEIPVQEYTGTPEISIPIYNIETKALNIPIVLSYHPNGIKVNEEASWVGLGWNLSTDMEIVHVVQGLDDYGYFKRRSLPDFNCLIPLQTGGLSASNVMSQCSTFFLGFDDNWNASNNYQCVFDPMYPTGLWDSEPDIFYFSAAGYSGKFALNWSTGLYQCLTDKNIKVESDVDGINSEYCPGFFSITFPDGNRFQFQLKESTTINESETLLNGTPANTFVDARGEKSSRVYKLIKIMTNKADVVDFEYEDPSIASRNFPYINLINRYELSDYQTYPVMSNDPLSFSSSVPVGNSANDIHFNSRSFNATEQTYSFLKKITYNNETIEFIKSPRSDLKEALKLDEIRVTNKGNFRRFMFTYDYFNSSISGNGWDSFLSYGTINPYESNKTQDEITKRLKLVSFNEINEKPYLFSYNSQSLPKKTSYALDYWGFYNGVHSNISFFPNLYRFNLQRENPFYYNKQDNNLSPVLSFCKAATLEKITYPTGGSSFFEYELNTFSNYKVPPADQGQQVTFNLTTVPSQNSITQKAVLIEGGNTIFNAYGLLSVQGCPLYTNPYYDCYFKVIHFKKELIDYIKNNSSYNAHLNSYGLMYVLGVDLDFLDGSPSNATLYNFYKDYENTIYKTLNENQDEWVLDRKINMSEGIAVFSVSGGCGVYSPTQNNNWSQSSFTIKYRDYKPLPEGDAQGAGLRIKSITSSPAICLGSDCVNNTTKKIYEYEGGKLMTPLLFFNKTRVAYSDHRVVGYTDGGCASAEAELESLKAQLTIEYAKYEENPNKATADRINEINSRMVSLPDLYGCWWGPQPIWVLWKNFIGYRYELHSQSYIQPSTSASGRYVGYDKVTEKQVNHAQVTTSPEYATVGKSITYYTNNPDIGVLTNGTGDGYFTEINIPLMKHYPENGYLTKQEIFDKNNTIKRRTLNTYGYRQESCLWGMKTLSTEVFEEYGFTGYDKKNKYLVGVYPIQSGKTILTSSFTSIFENGNEITENQNFEYDTHNQISKITTTNSKGELVEQLFSYPYNIGTSIYNLMVNRNMLTPVIETISKVNGINRFLEKKEYKSINITNPDVSNYFSSTYTIDKIKQSKGEYVDLEDFVIYHNYDKYANPTEVSKKDGTRVSYIWGYKGKYPIAKIENASQPTYDNATQGYTIIDSNLMSAAISASETGTEADLLLALENLRTSLPNAMVTTFTYKPLAGVSSITDPRGYKTTYHYDTSNRLQFVKDYLGQILSENEYHYKN